MDALRDIILLICVLGVFAFGYFLMARLDMFLYENRKYIDNEDKAEEPSCVILTENTSDKEIIEEVSKFREKHKNIRIAIYDSGDPELPGCIEYRTDQK